MSLYGSNDVISGPPHKWIFSREEMRRVKSITEGMSEATELEFRQKSAKFIHEMVEKLNERVDKAHKVSQGCMCAAILQMHRFFYFHSFNFFDYRDVAAACLFLAGKTEDNPRKLEHIVKVWWAKKFPRHPLPTTQHFHDAAALIVQLENVILQTIAFDLTVQLPHPFVLNLMQKCVGQVPNEHQNKKLTETAYFFATDVLGMTNWAIRYSVQAIAICCVHIVCEYRSHKIPEPGNGQKWYAAMDPTMTPEILEDMAEEFMDVYERSGAELSITRRFPSSAPIQFARRSVNQAPELLPPPPPPPSLPIAAPPPLSVPPPQASRSIDVNAYRARKSTPGTSERPVDVKPRKSFIPDMSQPIRSAELPMVNLPGMSTSSFSSGDAGSNLAGTSGRRDERRDEERRRDRDRERKKDEKERRHDDKDRERRREEERRKREHEKVSGRDRRDTDPSGHKRPRPDSYVPTQTFVPAGGPPSNGAKPPSSKPPSLLSVPLKRPLSPPRPPSTGRFDPPTALSPPPEPPSMVPSFTMKLKSNRDGSQMDLEDGEVE